MLDAPQYQSATYLIRDIKNTFLNLLKYLGGCVSEGLDRNYNEKKTKITNAVLDVKMETKIAFVVPPLHFALF